ncbi:HEXXH motif domain [Legionella busanensis]|uniref:HEXXH motif domain n=1 Tax=Legionella busanensis TaxID=190655 RepID=A0A378JNI5_9GAMM|nr:HEXXH motif-containing putative peptide modification protein [Legionella busanensis]STX52637.1 HEXXH motif domain [Legionella busanensis]
MIDAILNKLSAVPEIGVAPILHTAYQDKFIHSLKEIIDYADKMLGNDYQSLLNRIAIIESQSPKFISPRLYSSYFKLLKAMQNDDVTLVKQIISALKTEDYAWSMQEMQVNLGLQESWEKQIFYEEVCVAFGSDKLQASTPLSSQLEQFQADVQEAIKLIIAADFKFATEIETLVSTLFLVESKVSVGATSPMFFGAIYLSLPKSHIENSTMLFLIEHLVHETSHLFLNTILAYDPLILNEPTELFCSPIRTDLRPLLGIYHATFVLSRVIRIFKQIKHLSFYFKQKTLEDAISSLTKKYERAYQTTNQQASFTPLGKQIFISTRECALLN